MNTPAIVKIFYFFLVWVVSWLPIAIILANWLGWQPLQPLQTSQKLLAIVSLYLLAPVIIGGVISNTQKSWSSYGLISREVAKTFISLIFGTAIALSGLAIVFLGENIWGWLNFELESGTKLLEIGLPILVLALFIGGFEELIFRGFVQTELQQDYPPLKATIITSSIFALSHLIWEWDRTIPELPGLWLLGVILTQARWLNGGNLGLAWGLHAGWVWGLTYLDTAHILVYSSESPVWFIGWEANPLAGISGIACLLLTAVTIQLIQFPQIKTNREEDLG